MTITYFSPSTKGFYKDDFHKPKEIPGDVVEISDEERLRLREEEKKPYLEIHPDANGMPHMVRVVPPLDEAKAAKMVDINDAADAQLATITNQYPSSEVTSWSKQEAEARAYKADSNATAPLLKGIATARGIELADLVDKVIEKADIMAELSGSVFGQRQALESQLNSLATSEEVIAMAVTIP